MAPRFNVTPVIITAVPQNAQGQDLPEGGCGPCRVVLESLETIMPEIERTNFCNALVRLNQEDTAAERNPLTPATLRGMNLWFPQIMLVHGDDWVAANRDMKIRPDVFRVAMYNGKKAPSGEWEGVDRPLDHNSIVAWLKKTTPLVANKAVPGTKRALPLIIGPVPKRVAYIEIGRR
jgi:hypothetical protein